MRWPGEESPTPHSSGAPTGVSDGGALLPVRGLSAARLGADDVVPIWERLDGTRLVAGVAGPGPASAEATDPIRATRRAGRVLESLRARLENAVAPVGESVQPGFVAITVDSDDRDPLTILGSEVQLAAAVLDRADPSGGRVRLFWNGDARVFFLDAVALCRLTFEDAPSPGLPGPSAVWLRTVDVRPPTTGLVITCTHGAHGYFQAPWLLERAIVASLERATSWRGFAEQVRFALERETKSGASFSAFPWGASDFGQLRQAILGPGGQRLSDLAARQASAGGAGWLNAWLSLYGPIHERWRFTLHSPLRVLVGAADRAAAAAPVTRPPPIDAPTPAVNAEVESDSARDEDAPAEYAEAAAVSSAPGNPSDRPPNWGGVADALNRLSAEWARAARSDRPEPKAEPKPKGAVVPLRVVSSGGARREEAWAGAAIEARGLALATQLSPDQGLEPTPVVHMEVSSPPVVDSTPKDAAATDLSRDSVDQADDAAFRELDAETLTSDAFELLELGNEDDSSSKNDVLPLPHDAVLVSEAAAPTSKSPRTTSPQLTSPLVNSPFTTSASRVCQAAASPSVLEPAVQDAPPEFIVPDEVDGTVFIEAHEEDGELDVAFPVEPDALEPAPSSDDSMAVVLDSPIFEAEPAQQESSVHPVPARRWPMRVAAVAGIATLGVLVAFWLGPDDVTPMETTAEVASVAPPAPPNPVPTVTIAPRGALARERAAERRGLETAIPVSVVAVPAAPVQDTGALDLGRPAVYDSPTRSRYDIETAPPQGLAPLFAAAPPVAPPAVITAPPAVPNPAPTPAAVELPPPAVAADSRQTLASLDVEARVHLVLRRGPGVNYPRAGLLVPGTRTVATARKAGTNWVRVVVRGRPVWANFRRERLVPTTPGAFDQLETIP